MSKTLYLAPLQGFTDYSFRAAFAACFEIPDAAFSPFIETHRPENRMYRDVLPERNASIRLIPQLLGNNASEMLPVIAELLNMGYNEVNLNMGCPYPMVTRKNMGSGILPHAEAIDRLLNELCSKSTCQISVKMRLGMTNPDEYKKLIPILNRYPLSEVIIHGRTAKQMYEGEIDTEAFGEMAAQLIHPVCYNGNIFTLSNFNELTQKFPTIQRWMLGRGLIANPLLLSEIKNNKETSTDERLRAIDKLHDQLVLQNTNRLSGNSHILNKLRPYWQYFALTLENKHKALKKIKKAATLEAYLSACKDLTRA